MPGEHKSGFTLIELLVVIAIIVVISSVIMIIIKPLEIIRRSRDANRLFDLANLQLAINTLIQENHGSGSGILCTSPSNPPCFGSSNDPSPETRLVDGSGWVKVSFDPTGPISASTLPVDPVNYGDLVYTYATDVKGESWEINAVMESDREKDRMQQDGGNNPDKYEVGLNLSILP